MKRNPNVGDVIGYVGGREVRLIGGGDFTRGEIEARINTELKARTRATDAIETLQRAARDDDNRRLSDDEQTRADALFAELDAIDGRLDDLTTQRDAVMEREVRQQRADTLRRDISGSRARDIVRNGSQGGTGTIGREERTYRPDLDMRGERSYFSDWYNGFKRGDFMAQDRLRAHQRESEAEGETRGLEQRASSTGSYSTLVVPQYLVDQAAMALRTGRPVANAMNLQQLPEQGMSINIPRETTGAAVASQAAENTAVQNTDEVLGNLAVPVVTIAGQQDISRQAIERGTPGIDALVYGSLAGAYHAEVDRQVIAGSGASGQMLGILNTAGINAATAYGATITAQLLNQKIAGQIGAVSGLSSMLAANLVIMAARRWAWLNSLADTTGRPLVVPGVGGPMNIVALNSNPGNYLGSNGNTDVEDFTSVGSIQGLPILTDANVPTTVGTNVEDIGLVLDRRQGFLWELGDRQPKQLDFEQTLGGQLTVKLVIYSYAAFTAGRYPQAFGKFGGLDTAAGQGQVAPSF